MEIFSYRPCGEFRTLYKRRNGKHPQMDRKRTRIMTFWSSKWLCRELEFLVPYIPHTSTSKERHPRSDTRNQTPRYTIIFPLQMIRFDHTPDRDDIARCFPESPYFCEEAMTYRDIQSNQAWMLATYIWTQVVGVLTWSLSPIGNQLKIWLIEVHPDYRSQHIGRNMLLEIERRHAWKYESLSWSLNNEENTASKLMFLQAGYTSYDTLRYGKIPR